MNKIGDQPVGDRIPGPNNDDRQRCVLFGGDSRRITQGHDHRDPARNQFVDQLGEAIEVPMRRSPLKGEVLPKVEPAAGEAVDQPGRERALVGRFSAGRQ